jgi:hypothetical protein
MCLEAMLGISLYSYPYLKLAKKHCLSYIFSSTKLEKRAEEVLPGSEGGRGEREEVGYGADMAQTLYAYMNKFKKQDLCAEAKLKKVGV